jgi:hypothetical protein
MTEYAKRRIEILAVQVDAKYHKQGNCLQNTEHKSPNIRCKRQKLFHVNILNFGK